jgi:hypothetical protein
MAQAHVQVVLGGETIPSGLEAALRRIGATASFGPIADVLRFGLKPAADAVVVVAAGAEPTGADRLQALLNRVAAQPRGTLVLQSENNRDSRPAYPPAVPVSFSGPADPEEWAARIETMIAMRPSLDLIQRGRPTVTPADERLAEQYRRQLTSASRVQRQLLPAALPRIDGVSFSVVYRPADVVSGDIYDIRQLDDDHLAIAVVDTQGHGISAALLSVFIKRALRNKEIGDSGRHLPRPDHVLARLNAELLETELSETQFAAAVYAVFNLRTRRIDLARGGAPYPILRRSGGDTELLRPAGTLIGVIPDAQLAVESRDLQPGDSVIFYSDGLEPIVRPAELPPADAPDKYLTATPWYRHLRAAGVEPALEQLEQRHDTLRRLGRPLDDLTVFALSVTD